jgi:hypothetical protein
VCGFQGAGDWTAQGNLNLVKLSCADCSMLSLSRIAAHKVDEIKKLPSSQGMEM